MISMAYPQFGLDIQSATQSGFDAGWWDIRCNADISTRSILSGAVSNPKKIRGQMHSTGSATGSLAVPKKLAGRMTIHEDVLAILLAPKFLRGQLQNIMYGTGSLAVPKKLAGALTSPDTATASLSVPKILQAEIQAVSQTRAMLVVTKYLHAMICTRTRIEGRVVERQWPAGIEVYTRLVTSEHVNRLRYINLVKNLVSPLVSLQHTLAHTARAFDLDTAIGVQLDQVGLWVGVGRILRKGLEGVYFALDEKGVGFDEGVWKGPFDPETTLVSLPDDQYRTLIRARIAANQWDGTIPNAYAVWRQIFTESVIFIQDWQNMSMTVGIAGIPLNAVLRRLLTDGYIPLKPEGVRIDFYAMGTDAGPLFGFDTASPALAGCDQGQWAQELYPL